LSELPNRLDLVMVATTADVRPRLVSEIASTSEVQNWVLEKVLAQSNDGLSTIQDAMGPAARAWVNTPMYMWPLYRALADCYPERPPITARFIGFRGLACNAIHYFDFVARWNDAAVVSVDVERLKSPWYPSKRGGFFEVDGTLEASFSDGSILSLSSERENLGYRVEVSIGSDDWQVFESEGYAKSSAGMRINGGISFQSQLTAPMIEDIFEEGYVGLPTLTQSIQQHRMLLSPLLGHWNRCMAEQRSLLPIT
jgi:hypothetical protein